MVAPRSTHPTDCPTDCLLLQGNPRYFVPFINCPETGQWLIRLLPPRTLHNRIYPIHLATNRIAQSISQDTRLQDHERLGHISFKRMRHPWGGHGQNPPPGPSRAKRAGLAGTGAARGAGGRGGPAPRPRAPTPRHSLSYARPGAAFQGPCPECSISPPRGRHGQNARDWRGAALPGVQEAGEDLPRGPAPLVPAIPSRTRAPAPLFRVHARLKMRRERSVSSLAGMPDSI